jgi:hypothetical protein
VAKFRKSSLLLILSAAIWFCAAAQEKVDYKVIERIRDEGFNRSQVMEIA